MDTRIERKSPEEMAAIISDHPHMMGFKKSGKGTAEEIELRKVSHKKMLSRHKAKKKRK